MKIKTITQLQALKAIRKPTLPAPRKHKSSRDYNRRAWKRDLD